MMIYVLHNGKNARKTECLRSVSLPMHCGPKSSNVWLIFFADRYGWAGCFLLMIAAPHKASRILLELRCGLLDSLGFGGSLDLANPCLFGGKLVDDPTDGLRGFWLLCRAGQYRTAAK
jgi:hypothetical protein